MSNRQLYGEPLRLRQYRPLAEPSPSLWATLRVAWGRHRSRRRIAQLDPQMLKDMRVVLEDSGFIEGSVSEPGTFVVEKAFVER